MLKSLCTIQSIIASPSLLSENQALKTLLSAYIVFSVNKMRILRHLQVLSASHSPAGTTMFTSTLKRNHVASQLRKDGFVSRMSTDELNNFLFYLSSSYIISLQYFLHAQLAALFHYFVASTTCANT